MNYNRRGHGLVALGDKLYAFGRLWTGYSGGTDDELDGTKINGGVRSN